MKRMCLECGSTSELDDHDLCVGCAHLLDTYYKRTLDPPPKFFLLITRVLITAIIFATILFLIFLVKTVLNP